MIKEDLVAFEEDIKDCYSKGLIKYPIHLRGGCEDHLIEIFKNIKEEDYVLSTWASHLHALLKGIPADKVKQRILDGLSISLCFPEHRFFASGIVGNLIGVAVGIAQSSKQRVFVFLGDMAIMSGIAHEAMKYSKNFDLPIYWICEDNGVSVLTDTKKTWGCEKLQLDWDHPKLIYYNYINKYPHSGTGAKVAF